MKMTVQTKWVTYREIGEADLADVVAIESEVHAYPWKLGHFKDALKAGYASLLMQWSDQTIGYAIVMIVLDEAHLLNVSIAKSFQRKGLGRQLMQQVIALGQTKACKDLFLEVRESNHAAIRLYESMGFNEMSIRRNYYPADDGREDAILMGLAI